MQSNFALSTSTLFGFLLVLCRVGGIFVFVPIPGITSGAASARVFLSLTLTAALYPLWPKPAQLEQSLSALTAAIAAEAALGITLGLGVSFILEMFSMAAQISGLQAGYGFASTIDPNTQADSGVMLIVAQTLAGLLFLSTGLDRELIRVLAGSLETFPPGRFILTTGMAEALVRLGGGVFTLGVRLALPVVALLGLVDLSLALLGRLNAQLQLVTLAFPVKMLAALVLFGWIAAIEPRIFTGYAGQFLGFARHVTGVR